MSRAKERARRCDIVHQHRLLKKRLIKTLQRQMKRVISAVVLKEMRLMLANPRARRYKGRKHRS